MARSGDVKDVMLEGVPKLPVPSQNIERKDFRILERRAQHGS